MAPARLIRAAVLELPKERQRQARSPRQQDTAERILTAAETILDRFGRTSLTLSSLAQGLGIAPRTIRILFTDVETIVADLLTRHIEAVTNAVTAIPSLQPETAIARRQAYRAATRTPFGSPTIRHSLLLAELRTLPEDLREPLENNRRNLGTLLSPEDPDLVLTLLDQTDLTPEQIGATLALAAEMPASEPEVAPPHTAPDPPPKQPAPARLSLALPPSRNEAPEPTRPPRNEPAWAQPPPVRRRA